MTGFLDKIAKVFLALRENKTGVQIFFAIFYTVGIIGLSLPWFRDFFINLIPLALILSIFALIIFHQSSNNHKIIVIFAIIGVFSFFVEVAGVKTQEIFGPYTYGKGLGVKIFDTPLLIGINWMFMVYCSAVLARKITSGYLSVVVSSIIMLIYDVVLEQAAPLIDMWKWKGNVIPLQNYIAWFLLAFIFQSVLSWSKVKFSNQLVGVILLCQTLFFACIIFFFR